MRHTREQIQFLDMVPADRGIGNQALREALGWDEHRYERVRCELLHDNAIVLGKGRGGSVRRPDADEQRLLRLLPEDGSFRTNASVLDELEWSAEQYWEVRRTLQDKGLVRLGTGHGGRVARVVPEHLQDLVEEIDEIETSVDETPDAEEVGVDELECTRPNSMGAAYDEFIQDQARVLRALRLQDWTPGEWTYPREMARVLEAVGMDVPQRLRTQRFCELLTILDKFGIEMKLADADEDEAFTVADKSPGIDVRVRLRRRASTKFVNVSRDVPERKAQGMDPPETEKPLPPIEVVQTNTDPTKVITTFRPKVSHYTLALLKLQFLTAIPSIDRQHSPDWPGSFLEAAQRGLVLQPLEMRLLNTVAAGRVRGQHSPFDVITDLTKYLDGNEWAELVNDLRRLNPAMADVVDDIEQYLKHDRHLPIPQTHLVSNSARSVSIPLAAHGPAPASTSHAAPRVSSARAAVPHEAASNHRSLGALDELFDDHKKA